MGCGVCLRPCPAHFMMGSAAVPAFPAGWRGLRAAAFRGHPACYGSCSPAPWSLRTADPGTPPGADASAQTRAGCPLPRICMHFAGAPIHAAGGQKGHAISSNHAPPQNTHAGKPSLARQCFRLPQAPVPGGAPLIFRALCVTTYSAAFCRTVKEEP